MESRFGVQLKSKDETRPAGTRTGSPGRARPPGSGKRTELKTKPVSDLKAMFDKSDGTTASKAFKDIGTSQGKTTTVTKTTGQTVRTSVTKGTTSTTSTEQVKCTSRTVTKTTSNELNKEDKDAFEALRVKFKKTGLNVLEDDKEVVKSSVAVAKTYNGGVAYKASVETKKISKAGDEGEGEVSRGNVASFLSVGLTRLRCRPDTLKDNLSRSDSVEDASLQTPNSPRSESPRSQSPTLRELNKDCKYIPGAPKGWKSSVDSGRSSPSSNMGRFSDSSVGKLKQENTGPKVPGFRSVSPNTVRNSSDDSSSSSNISPRGYKPTNAALSPRKDGDKKTDVNKNISKLENNNSANVFKNESASTNNKAGTKGTGVAQFKKTVETTPPKSKLAREKSDLSSSRLNTAQASRPGSGDSDKGRGSPRLKGDFKWSEKGRLSLEEIKREQGHRPLSRASSSGSNSSFSRGDSENISKLAQRYSSPEPADGSATKTVKTSDSDIRLNMTMTKKLGTGKFQELKKGFEHKPDQNSTSPKLDKKFKTDINSKKILERKQSFEGGEIFKKKYERQELVSPRDKGNVLQTIKSLNQLDAQAKAQPALMRRTRSLPSDSMEEDSSADYYQDIDEHPPQHLSVKDDVSNEGDISSESDQLYEEITMGLKDRSPMKDRRATAFRKRKKQEELQPVEIPTGSDSDTDYESYEEEGYQVSESDSIDPDKPPELPPPRNPNLKKKKKKEEKGTRPGIREKFKKLYKGKSATTEGALQSAVSSSLVAAAPQSGGVLSKLKKKDLKKSKGGNNSQTNLEVLASEENPYCDSDGTDTDFDTESQELKQVSVEKCDEGTMEKTSGTAPPPLPPRHSGLVRTTSGSEIGDNASQLTVSSPTERRASIPPKLDIKSEKDPPLPPRNRVSQNIDLSMVVPIVPGGGKPKSPQPQPCDMRKSGWPPVSDSYLHGQRMDTSHHAPPTSPDLPYMDDTPSPVKDAPPLPERAPPKRPLTGKDSYIDCGDVIKPPLPQKSPNRSVKAPSTDSYVDVGDMVLPEDNYSLADEIRKELEKRPASSAYIKAHDLSSVPEPRSKVTAPFEDMLKFRHECEEDGLYIDLSDEQVYGTLGSRYHSKLENENLYQFYNTDKITRASRRKAIYSSFDESDEESYTEGEEDDREDHDRVYEDLSTYSSGRGSMELDKRSTEGDTSSTSSKVSTLDMFKKEGSILRTLWADMPEVKANGVLNTINAHDRKLQESLFEILTSEATYLKSINILINVFLMSEEFGSDLSNKCVLTKQERHVLFSNIGTIRDTSERFLSELEAGWQKSVMLNEVCDVITKHASQYFECYVHYCSNQTFQDKALTELKKKPEFLEAIRRLESSPTCQGLPMISFLLLPMQRVTRLPLLVDAICHRLDPIKDKEKHKSAINAFNALSKVVRRCNDGAKKMQQTEQMFLIAKQLEFPTKEITQIPLVSASRYLVKQGEVVRIANEAKKGMVFGKSKPSKQNVHLFLFSDILVVTKKKGAQFIVTDYAQRNSLHVETIEHPEKHRLLPNGTPSGCKHLFLLVMLENHEKLMMESVFSCSSVSDRARWVDAVTPVRVTDDQERIYEEWDCPQVQCVKKYQAMEPDELALEESDVVNVFKKLDDGMWEGERLRDGERGWFPKDHTVEIINSHVRARNMRTKYRLMAAAEQTNR